MSSAIGSATFAAAESKNPSQSRRLSTLRRNASLFSSPTAYLLFKRTFIQISSVADTV